MAKIVYLCMKDGSSFEGFPEKISRLNRRITPENINPNPPQIVTGGGVMAAVINPTSELLIQGASTCLGFPIFVPPDWHVPGGADPDGSYALFRSDGSFVELGTDVGCTRTIWYCQTDKAFIASNSQRAIVAFLGDFQVNELVFPNMLACGLLGPFNSWDKRIHYLEPDEHLILDRRTWKITRRKIEYEYNPSGKTREDFVNQLAVTLKDVFSHIKFDPSSWPLALSGGVDSRAILAFLQQEKIRCVTWGPKNSFNDPESDPSIARAVAGAMNADFHFFETDGRIEESGETILQRFIEASEGRVDHITAYRDGFRIWKTLFENGYQGLIRGDEFVGLEKPVTTERMVFTQRNYHLLQDYANWPAENEFGLKMQSLPPEYERRPKESLTAWAYRIDLNYHKVVEMSALNEIKASFLELMNPLISRRVQNVIQTIPFRMNLNKKVFREVVKRCSPPIKFAAAKEKLENILRDPKFREAVTACMKSPEAEEWLSGDLIHLILERISKPDQEANRSLWEPLILSVKKAIPHTNILSKFIRRKQTLDNGLLAFRALIIVKSCQLFSEDAKFFKDGQADST